MTASGAGLVVWKNADSRVLKAVIASSAGILQKAQTMAEDAHYIDQLAVNARGEALILWENTKVLEAAAVP